MASVPAPATDLTARYCVVDGPLGPLALHARGDLVTSIEFGERLDPRSGTMVDPDEDPLLARAADQVAAFLAGTRMAFDLPIDLDPLPAFDRAVYGAMLEIPYGSVATYGALAQRIGSPRAARAVGGACNRNPLPIVVPCHRVVASDGSLGGYGGGLDRKRALLALERDGDVPPGGWEARG